MLKIRNNHIHDDKSSQIVSWGHWFTLFNIFLIIILGSRYLFIADWPPTLLGRFYAIISSIGHFSFITFVCYLIFLFPLSFIIHSSRWQRIIATVVATILIAIMLIDIEVFQRFRMHINLSLWEILTDSDDSIFSAEWQRIFIFVPFILLLESVFAIWSWKKLRSLTKRRRYSRPFIICFILCFISSHLIHIWADAYFYRPITMQRSSLPLSYPMTARHFLENYGLIESGDYQTRFKQEGNPFALAIEYPLGKISSERLSKPYNILVIAIDDWYNQIDTESTPFLSQFAEEQINFTQHYSSADQAFLGNFSLFYGLDPNYYNSILVGHKTSALMDTLIEQKYSLGLFAANGFDHPFFRYALLLNFSMLASEQHSNQKTTDYWLSWYYEHNNLDKPTPWFSLVNYQLEANSKNDDPKSNDPENKNPNHQQNNLMANMTVIDQSIEKIITTLREKDELDTTIVIITAANRLMPDDNVHSNNIDYQYSHTALNVPLIVAWPGKVATTSTKRTTHVDIMTTLMQDALNTKTATNNYSQGRNLFADEVPKWIIAGNENEIAALYTDKTIVIDANGHYRIYDKNNQLVTDAKLGLSTFLQLISENRRFMVTN